MAGTIQGTFGWDNAPFINAMNEAERVAGRGASNIQNRFTSIFKRSPNMRAERAFSGLFQDLASGNVAGAIESVTSRMTGLGLAAGVAIGAGVAIFIKWKEQIDAADAAVEKIREHLATPMKIASAEGIREDIGLSQKNIKDVEKASQSFGARIRQAFRDEGKDGFLASGRERTFAGNPQQSAASAERKRLREDVSHLADLELKTVEARRIGLEVGTKDGQLAELRLKTAKEMEKIQSEFGLNKPGRDATQLFRMMAAAKEDNKLSEDSINHQADARERSLVVEEKMAKLIRGGLTGEDQKKVRAGLELGNINSQLATETNPETRRALLLQKAQKENELRGMGKPGEENPFSLGTTSARDWERSQDSMKFNSQFASFGLTQQQQDTKGPASPNAEVVSEVAKTNELLKQIFLKP